MVSPGCARLATTPWPTGFVTLTNTIGIVSRVASGKRKKTIKLRVSGPIASRDFGAVSTFTYKGHGIGSLPSAYGGAEIASGSLIRLLSE
jgi:hypothetical protein